MSNVARIIKTILIIGLLFWVGCSKEKAIEKKNIRLSDIPDNPKKELELSFLPNKVKEKANLESLSDKIDFLQKQIDTLQEAKMVIFKEITSIQERINILSESCLQSKRQHSILLDPSTPKKYHKVDTDCGFFLISLQDIISYLDGYKIILHIGNPSSATYSGFILKVKWGKKEPEAIEDLKDAENYIKWKESLKEKEISFLNHLEPGKWNKVEFILSPATYEQLGYLELSIDTSSIILLEKEEN